jgi:putative redox protein
MTLISCRYEGQLRCSAAHTPSGSTLITDAPVDNQGKGEAFSPTDLVATALVSCILTIMGITAGRHGIDLGKVESRVEKTMTSSGVRRIARLEVWISLPPGLTEEQRSLLIRAGETCPVKESLEGAVPMLLNWS